MIKIRYNKQSSKFFKQHQAVKNKFIANLKAFYLEETANVDIKRLQTPIELYRMRIGKYRVIYSIEKNTLILISVEKADTRGDIYKNLP